MTQFSLPLLSPIKEHGGTSYRRHAKVARPIAIRRPMHVTFKASCAHGKLSLLRKSNAQSVRRLLSEHSRRFQIRVYRAANVGNHIHVVLRAKTRKGMQSFLRAFPGALAMAVTGDLPWKKWTVI